MKELRRLWTCIIQNKRAMSKNKYEFISDILESKKLNQVQKERILKLASSALKNDFSDKDEIEKRLIFIEKKLGFEKKTKEETINQDIKEDNSITNNNSNLPKYLYPSNLYKYLFAYNQNIVLKSTCHEIDSNELEVIIKYCGTDEYIFEKHLEKIIEAFGEHNKLFAPPDIKALIRGYLIGKDYKGEQIRGWSTDGISFNWSSPQLRTWSLDNKNVPPNIDKGLMNQIEKTGYEFKTPVKIRRGELNTFSDLVIHFKKLFHIRSDNSLKDIIKRENETKRWVDNIDFEVTNNDFPNNIEFFTDVDKLIQGYNKLIELILKQNEKQNLGSKAQVKLSLIQTDRGMTFSILHKKSIYAKTVRDVIDRLGLTYPNLIKYQLNGLCNFYLKADFENEGSYEIELWNRPNLWVKEKPNATQLTTPVGGVEHIFEFIKTA